MTDLLSDILRPLRLRGNLYYRTELSAPWGIEVPADRQIARFHVVLHGGCWLRVAGVEELVYLAAGDLVIVPHGSRHEILAAPDTPCRPLAEVLAAQPVSSEGLLRYGGGGEQTALVCGYFNFDEDVLHPLLASLPRRLHIKGRDNLNSLWLDTALRFISSEAGTGLPGSQALVERMSEILFIQVIRAYATIAPEEIRFLAALHDESLSRILKEIHRRPAHKWTLGEMAHVAGTSRSTLVERFTAQLGLPPARYLTSIRMLQARLALETEQKSLLQIANAAGYQSEAAFSTAFKRYFGRSPGAYRKH